MRRPAPRTLKDIRHPGPTAADRTPHALCHAERATFPLAASGSLLGALGQAADNAGYVSAVLNLSGVELAPFAFVMPDRAIDDRHAAWYSDTHSSKGAVLDDAVAILGWRDGTWFAHVHAYWHEDGHEHLGHLMPDTLALANDARITGYGINGARFEAAFDPETEFKLFRVKDDPESLGDKSINALITTLTPFSDLHESIKVLGASLPGSSYSAHGLGSLAGAEFSDSEPMTGLISEILLQNGSGMSSGGELSLAMRAVDLNKNLYQGHAKSDGCPTLVTNELLLVSDEN